MAEFRSTILYIFIAITVGVILIATWHSLAGGTGALPETGLGPSATPQPTAVAIGGTTLTPSEQADAHLIPSPDAGEIPAAGREYEVSLKVYESIDLALTTRGLRFSGLRTGTPAVDTGHECVEAAVREVIATRDRHITTITALLDRAPGDDITRTVNFRLLGPGTNLSESAIASGYQDVDSSGDYNEDDEPAQIEASVQWQNLIGGEQYTVYASTHAGYPSHQTRGTTWTVGRESEAVRDPVVASRVHAPAGSFITLSACQRGASAELLLIDGESMAAHGDGGRIVRIYGVETSQ